MSIQSNPLNLQKTGFCQEKEKKKTNRYLDHNIHIYMYLCVDTNPGFGSQKKKKTFLAAGRAPLICIKKVLIFSVPMFSTMLCGLVRSGESEKF
jgi:hypothetical protein